MDGFNERFIKLASKKWVSNMDMAREIGSYKGSTRLNELETELLTQGKILVKRWVYPRGEPTNKRFKQYRISRMAK